MKLFPTNLFSSGQSQSDPSQLKNAKAENSFASLMQEGTIEISRSPINDASMGLTEESHEVVSRSDQAAPKSRRKAENRDRTKIRGKEDQTRETESVEARSAERSRESDRSQSSDDKSRNTASVKQENRRSKDMDATDSQDTQVVNGEKVDASAVSNETVEKSDLRQGEVTDIAGAANATAEVSEVPTLGLPNLALLAQVEPAGMPVTDAYPLVGATLLSPAALGGIEGLSDSMPALAQNAALSEMPTELLNTVAQATTSIADPQNAGSTGLNSLQIGPELMKSLGQVPVSEAAKAMVTEVLQQQAEQAEVLSSSTQNLGSSTQSLNQTGQSLLGGSLFQEMAQKSLQNQFQSQENSGSTLGEADGTSISELPAEFQQAKAVFTQVDAQPALVQQHAETLSQMHGNASDEVEGENQGTGAEKSTTPLAGLNRNPATATPLSGQGNQTVQVAAEVSQEQNVAQRVAQRTATQQILFKETAPTPEGHVSPLTEVIVEVDDDLRVAVKTSGREVMVSLDGTSRAIQEMAGIGPELQDSLEDMGFTLSQFSTNEDNGQSTNEDNPTAKKSSAKENSTSTTQANLGPIRQVRRGGQVDTVA